MSIRITGRPSSCWGAGSRFAGCRGGCHERCAATDNAGGPVRSGDGGGAAGQATAAGGSQAAGGAGREAEEGGQVCRGGTAGGAAGAASGDGAGEGPCGGGGGPQRPGRAALLSWGLRQGRAPVPARPADS